MNSLYVRWLGRLLCSGIVLFCSSVLSALEPPTAEQVEQYKADGTWEQRVAQAKALGNHLAAPGLAARTKARLQIEAAKASGSDVSQMQMAPPPAWRGGLPFKGTAKALVLLVDFSDYPHGSGDTVADVSSKFFGAGDANQKPYESLHNFYARSSYNQLDIQGNVLGWYRAQNTRSYYETAGNEALIMEAMNYYNNPANGGHDFTQYDNDGDGKIEAFYIKWTGPAGPWASFWWAYQTGWWQNSDYRIDGKSLGSYVWSWIWNSGYDGQTIYQAHVDIHETGHLLGLPDLYDYDGNVGPDGGVGGLDMMDANKGDHNCFSKFMLEWLTPTFITSGSTTLSLNPTASTQDCVLIMPGVTAGNAFDEFFMAQYRKRTLSGGATCNDSPLPTDGYTVWHIDSRLTADGGNFMYDNSYAPHKLVRLMEADGQEQIESGGSAGSADFYTSSKTFTDSTTPNSRDYSKAFTGVQVDNIGSAGTIMSGRFSISPVVKVAAAGWSLDSESFLPANQAVDPGETVTIELGLRNVGSATTSNLVATLQAGGGVTSPSGPQTYGTLGARGQIASQPFTFAATGNCGDALTVTLQLQDGTTNLGLLTFNLRLGQTPLNESFDSMPAPALPGGWTTTVSVGGIDAWLSNFAQADSGCNSVFAPDPAVVSDIQLISPTLAIRSAIAQLTFRHYYRFEQNYDAGVLEISTDGGAFTDIVSAGGSFAAGGYTAGFTVPSNYSNPLAGRQGWTGNSGGFITTTVNLPAAADGHNIQLCWRLGSDSGVSAAGWYVDTAAILNNAICHEPLMQAFSSSITSQSCLPYNQAVDPDETVTVNLSLRNIGINTTNLVATLLPTGGVTSPSGPQTYGATSPTGSVVTRPFSFTAAGVCGNNLIATLELHDSAINFPPVTFNFPLGVSDGSGGYDCCVIPHGVGDFNGDLDVDQEDFGFFQACLTANGELASSACQPGRLDQDVDVDQDDLEVFKRCHTQAGTPADPDCRN